MVLQCRLLIIFQYQPIAIFFPSVIFYAFSSFLLIYGGLGVGVLYGVFGVRISVDGVMGQWCGTFDFLGVGALYINIKELPWKNALPTNQLAVLLTEC